MRVGIIRRMGGEIDSWTNKYAKILEFNGIEYLWLNVNDLALLEKAKTCDLIIYHWAHQPYYHQVAHTLLPLMEHELGLRVLPNQATGWHYDDKIRQAYLMHSKGFPFVDTWVFWDMEKALQWLPQAKLPLVFKLRGGAGSTNVRLVKTQAQAERLVRQMFLRGMNAGSAAPGSMPLRKLLRMYAKKFVAGHVLQRQGFTKHMESQYVMFQKFMPGNKFDTRITTVGNRAFGFLRHNRRNDFRASGSGLLDYNTPVDMRCVQMALEVSQACGFQTMAYDFLFDEDGSPKFCEISYTYLDTAVHACPFHWDANLNKHEGHYWTEYLQLVDALNMPDLKQPEF